MGRKNFIFSIFTWPFKLIWFNARLWWAITNRPDYVEVKEGERFLLLLDIETIGGVHFKAPTTGGFKCTIPRGTVLIAWDKSRPETGSFSCLPENEKEFEESFVPIEDRNNQKYAGYSLVMGCNEIGKRIKRIE
ncbi:MAG: hypothetical protein M3362_21195 [Acidobacteriota bacterium]|nr:hypothetical protein [Acidobacteriota bacterium]